MAEFGVQALACPTGGEFLWEGHASLCPDQFFVELGMGGSAL